MELQNNFDPPQGFSILRVTPQESVQPDEHVVSEEHLSFFKLQGSP